MRKQCFILSAINRNGNSKKIKDSILVHTVLSYKQPSGWFWSQSPIEVSWKAQHYSKCWGSKGGTYQAVHCSSSSVFIMARMFAMFDLFHCGLKHGILCRIQMCWICFVLCAYVQYCVSGPEHCVCSAYPNGKHV